MILVLFSFKDFKKRNKEFIMFIFNMIQHNLK